MNFNFKKNLGQNFIRSTESILNFVNALELSSKDRLLEIGPGNGAITEYMAMSVKKLLLLEIDDELIPHLEEQFGYLKQVEILHADVLKVLPDEVIKKHKINKIAGALPYNISKPIINNFCMNPDFSIDLAVFILQKEVAEDYAGIGKKGSFLNHIYSLRYKVELIEVIEKSNFFPVPGVDSATIKFAIKPEKEIKLPTESQQQFIKFARNAFQNPRKKLKKNLKNIYREKDWDVIFDKLKFVETVRVEELSQEELLDLYKEYEQA
jgi:16S rRNA (adenine1518-N6/adenine1519-N6)-dimethyltransferase